MALIKVHARAKISYAVAIEMIKMASRSSLWLAEREQGQSNSSFNLHTSVCFWSGKICFIEGSLDVRISSVHAAHCLMEMPSYCHSIENNNIDMCFPALSISLSLLDS